MPVHPNSLANLRPQPWQPGESGNPEGRKTAGAYIREHINSLIARELTDEQLRKIAKDKKESVGKRAAAKRLLAMIKSDSVKDRTQEATAFVVHESDGNPTQRTESVNTHHITIDSARAQIRAMLTRKLGEPNGN
jgi:hypothetical protein